MSKIKDLLEFFGSQYDRIMKIQIVFDIFVGVIKIQSHFFERFFHFNQILFISTKRCKPCRSDFDASSGLKDAKKSPFLIESMMLNGSIDHWSELVNYLGANGYGSASGPLHR
jgi:hypothetical protein